MFDGVAAGSNRELQTVAAERVARRLPVETMGFVDDRLQHRQRIHQHVLGLACRTKRVGTGREQLDPVDALGNLLAHGGAPFVSGANHLVVERILRALRWIRIPANAAAGDLKPWTLEVTHRDRVANVHIGKAVTV